MKSLNDILKGKKESKIVPASTGDDPAVDYAAVSKKERDLVAKHKVEKHEDRVGNETVPYKTTLSKAKFARHGKDTVAAGKATYEETEVSGEQLDELSKKTLISYRRKANKDMDKSLDRRDAAIDSGDLSSVAKGNADFDKRFNGRKLAGKKLKEEQLDELSNDTLKSYKKKATDDMWDKKDEAEDNARRASAKRSSSDVDGYYKHRDAAGKARQKANNRAKGILSASDKLNKEETKTLRAILKDTE
jgi:hypothetical protein